MQPVVGIDASRYPAETRTGIETYSRELLDAMAGIGDLPFAVRFYLNRSDAANGEGVVESIVATRNARFDTRRSTSTSAGMSK